MHSHLIMDRKKKKLPFACDKCSSSFTKKGDLTRHIDCVHLGIQYHCDKCGMGFSRGYRRDKHFRTCGQPKNFCTKCCVDFKSEVELNLHITAHHIDLKYACSICDKLYACLQALRVHARTCGVKSESIARPKPRATFTYKQFNGKLIKVNHDETSSRNSPKKLKLQHKEAQVSSGINTTNPVLSVIDRLMVGSNETTSSKSPQTSSPIPTRNWGETPSTSMGGTSLAGAQVSINKTISTTQDSDYSTVTLDGTGTLPLAAPGLTNDGSDYQVDLWAELFDNNTSSTPADLDLPPLTAAQEEELISLERMLEEMCDRPNLLSPSSPNPTTSVGLPIPSTSRVEGPTAPPLPSPSSPTTVQVNLQPIPSEARKKDGTITLLPIKMWELVREISITNAIMTHCEDLYTLESHYRKVIKHLRRANEESVLSNNINIEFG